MATKKKPAKKKSGAKPTNPALYARVKAEAKRKFKVYPSAYANGYTSNFLLAAALPFGHNLAI